MFCFGWVTQAGQEFANKGLSANRYTLFRGTMAFFSRFILSRIRQTFYHTSLQIQELQFKTCKRFLALHHQLVSRPCTLFLRSAGVRRSYLCNEAYLQWDSQTRLKWLMQNTSIKAYDNVWCAISVIASQDQTCNIFYP
jgi:hypothetical protein